MWRLHLAVPTPRRRSVPGSIPTRHIKCFTISSHRFWTKRKLEAIRSIFAHVRKVRGNRCAIAPHVHFHKTRHSASVSYETALCRLRYSCTGKPPIPQSSVSTSSMTTNVVAGDLSSTSASSRVTPSISAAFCRGDVPPSRVILMLT